MNLLVKTRSKRFGTRIALSMFMRLNIALYLILFLGVELSIAQKMGHGAIGDKDTLEKKKSFELRNIENNAFKVGEKLKYRLHYGFIDAGEAVLEVKNSDKIVQKRNLIHIVGNGRSLGAFNWFFKVRDRYESYVDEQGIFPWIFIRRVNEGGYEIEQDYLFFQHKGKVKTKPGKMYDVEPSVQDMLSAFYYARTIDYNNVNVGDTFTVVTFLDEEIFPLTIKFIGRETISIREGDFKCMKFCPVVQKGRIFKKEEDLTVWISDDKNKIPLLAKAKILVGSIKMELVSYEGLANPIAKIE